MTDAEWKKRLTAEQYQVLRKGGTERAGTGKLLANQEIGTYTCVGCGAELFGSQTKFESGTGWPSFWAPLEAERVSLLADRSLFGMHRVEVRCAGCDGHLGHVFEDGPAPTGQRFCINSVCLDFAPS